MCGSPQTKSVIGNFLILKQFGENAWSHFIRGTMVRTQRSSPLAAVAKDEGSFKSDKARDGLLAADERAREMVNSLLT